MTNRILYVGLAMYAVGIVGVASFWGLVAYIVYHFVSKFW